MKVGGLYLLSGVHVVFPEPGMQIGERESETVQELGNQDEDDEDDVFAVSRLDAQWHGGCGHGPEALAIVSEVSDADNVRMRQQVQERVLLTSGESCSAQPAGAGQTDQRRDGSGLARRDCPSSQLG